MTDPRPSENTDSIPQWDGFRAFGFFDDVPNGDDFLTEPEAGGTPGSYHRDEAHSIVKHNASMSDPHGLAQAHALLYVGDQLARIADALAGLDITVEYPGGDRA